LFQAFNYVCAARLNPSVAMAALENIDRLEWVESRRRMAAIRHFACVAE